MSIRTKLFTYGAVAAGVVYLLKSSRKTPAAIALPVDDEPALPVDDEPALAVDDEPKLSVVEAAPEVVEEKPAAPKKRKSSTRRRRSKRVAA